MGKTYKRHRRDFDDDYVSDFRKPNKPKKDEIREKRKQKADKMNHIGEDDDDSRHNWER